MSSFVSSILLDFDFSTPVYSRPKLYSYIETLFLFLNSIGSIWSLDISSRRGFEIGGYSLFWNMRPI